jgi:hypothetical protein
MVALGVNAIPDEATSRAVTQTYGAAHPLNEWNICARASAAPQNLRGAFHSNPGSLLR